MKTLLTILIATATALLLFQVAGDNSVNCHNYAWETERGWLEDPSAYIAAATECEPEEANRIVYYDGVTPLHSGLYLGGGWVKSKWGRNAVLVHPVLLAPYNTSHVRYYR